MESSFDRKMRRIGLVFWMFILAGLSATSYLASQAGANPLLPFAVFLITYGVTKLMLHATWSLSDPLLTAADKTKEKLSESIKKFRR